MRSSLLAIAVVTLVGCSAGGQKSAQTTDDPLQPGASPEAAAFPQPGESQTDNDLAESDPSDPAQTQSETSPGKSQTAETEPAKTQAAEPEQTAAPAQRTKTAPKDDDPFAPAKPTGDSGLSGPLDAKTQAILDSYDAKYLSTFVKLLNHENPKVRQRAADKIGYLDEQAADAVPALIAALTDPNVDVRESVADALRDLGPTAKRAVDPLVARVKDKQEAAAVRQACVYALGDIGPDAASAAPLLIKALPHEDWSQPAAYALGRMGKAGQAAIPQLNKLMQEAKYYYGGQSAAEALGRLGAVESLTSALSSKEPTLRQLAANGLGFVNPATKEVVAALGTAAQDKKKDVRQTAVSSLGRLEPKLDEAIPHLLAAIKDEEDDVRQTAMYALSDYEGKPTVKLAAMFEQLKHEKQEVRESAVGSISGILNDSEEATVLAVAAIGDTKRNKLVRIGVLRALGRYYGDARPVKELRGILENTEEPLELRAYAAEALRRFDEQHAQVIPVLLEALKSDLDVGPRKAAAESLGYLKAEAAIPLLAKALAEPELTAAAANALAQMGKAAKPAVADLLKVLKREKVENRGAVYYALGAIGPDAEAAIPALIAGINDEGDGSWYRDDAATALGQVGKNSPQAVDALIAALKSDNEYVQGNAAEALAGIGENAKRAIPAIAKLLDDKEPGVRTSALDALATFGPDAKEALPAIIAQIEDKEQSVRYNAVEAMPKVGPQSPEIVPALVKALRDPSENVRRQAVWVLRDLGPLAKDAAPALTELIVNEEGEVYSEVIEVLTRLGADAKVAVPTLAKLLTEHEDALVRSEAAEALGMIGGDAKEAVPALSQSLEDENSAVRQEAAKALFKIAPNNQAAVARLSKAFQDPNSQARIAALITDIGRPAAPVLLEALQSPQVETRRQAARLLAGYQFQGVGGDALLKAMRDDDAQVRKLAALCVAQGEPGQHTRAAVPLLVELLKENDDDLKYEVQSGLSSMGPAAAEPLAELFAADQTNPAVRQRAAKILLDNDAQHHRAVPHLEQALKDADPNIRYTAALLLVKNDPYHPRAATLLRGVFNEGDSTQRAAAVRLYPSLGLGDEAVDVLVQALQDDSQQVRQTAAYALSPYGGSLQSKFTEIVKLLNDKQTRLPALQVLNHMGPDAAPALPELVAMLKLDEDTRQRAIYVFSNIGKPAVPKLIALVQDAEADAAARIAAMQALAYLGESAKQVVPAVVEALKNATEPSERLAAASAVARLGEPNETAMQVLVEHLTAEDYREYSQANSGLWALGTKIKPVVPALRKLLDHQQADVRGRALDLLGNVVAAEGGGTSDPLFQAILKAFRSDPDENVRNNAQYALARVGSPAVPALLESLNATDDPALQARILQTLRNMEDSQQGIDTYVKLLAAKNDRVSGHAAVLIANLAENDDAVAGKQAAIKKLTELLQSGDEELRSQAVNGLERFGEDAESAVPALVQFWSERPNEYAAQAAVEAVAEISSDTKQVLPALTKALEHKQLARSAIYALGQMGPDAAPAVPALLKLFRYDRLIQPVAAALTQIGEAGQPGVDQLILKLNTRFQCYDAARGLGQMSALADKKVRSVLMAKLHADDPQLRVAAVEGLGNLDTHPERVLKALAKALEDPYCRRTAARLLGYAGEPAVVALPNLLRVVNEDPDPQNRVAALYALRGIGGKAKPAVPDLLKLLKSPSRQIREAALSALRFIDPEAARKAIRADGQLVPGGPVF